MIVNPVNLCAKLEKHNRTALSWVLTTYETFDLAEKQGSAASAIRDWHQ